MPEWNSTPLADRPPDQRLAVVGPQPLTVGGRVHQHAAAGRDDEVARQPDPLQPHADPVGDLDLDDREADRQPDAAPGHEVEQRVARVVELRGGRSAEAGLAVEHVVEPVDRDVLRVADVEADPRPLRERVEDRHGRGGVDVRPAVGGDRQRADRQVELGLGQRDDAGEPRQGRRSGGLDRTAPDRPVRREPTRGTPTLARTPWYAARIPTGPVGYPVEGGSHRRDRRANRARPAAPRATPRQDCPTPDLRPPTIAESGDPFAAARIAALIARLERGQPIRIADVVDRLNATYLDWLFTDRVVVDAILQLQTNWMADYRNASGIVVDDGPYGPTIEIEDSSRVDPWIVRQVERELVACRERLDAFSRLDRAGGEG